MKDRIRFPVKVDEDGCVIRDANIRAHAWRLNVPASVTGSKKQRLFFATEKLAKQKRDELLNNRAGIPAKKIAELASRGMTVEQAINYAIEHAPIISNLTFTSLTDRYTEYAKTEVLIGHRYAASLASCIKKICAEFGEDYLGAITEDRLQNFLKNLKGRDGISPASHDTRNHYIETFKAVFNFAKKKHLISYSPAEGIKKIGTHNEEEIAILEIADVEKLLRALASPDHREVAPAALIQLFAGPRRSELPHINWKILNDHYLRLDKVKRGTKKRPVAMHPTLLAWLAPYRKPDGPIFAPAGDTADLECIDAKLGPERTKAKAEALRSLEDAYTSRLEKAAKDAGIELPKNVLRHTAITMRLNKTEDLVRTARWAGNSPGVIERDYLGIATPEDAEKFYALTPTRVAVPVA